MSPETLPSEHTWIARSGRAITAVYVVAVFVGFMALAHFVFHSTDAVKALALAGIGSLVPLIASISSRIEYRLTQAGLEKRRVQSKKPGEFKEVFSWEELSHVTPTKSGFKYYKEIAGANPITRFLKLHVLSSYSGEFHVEEGEKARLLVALHEKGIPTSKGKVIWASSSS